MNEDKKPYGKWVAKLARLKFRFGRGQSYVSIVNTMLLLILTFHLSLSNPILLILVGFGTLFGVFMVGLLDDRVKLIHAESDHNVEATTPYFAKLKADVARIKEMLEERERKNGNA